MLNKGTSKYIILVRHASRKPRWDLSESRHSIKGYTCSPPASISDFDEPGFFRTYAMAGRLCDQLDSDDISVEKILSSQHVVAEQTANIFAQVIRRRYDSEIQPELVSFLTPSCNDNSKQPEGEITWEAVKQNNGAVIVVGHQPQLTGIANSLLGKNPLFKLKSPVLPTGVLPIGSSEIACLQQGEEARLAWLITSKSQTLLNELREKIKSKYDVAKFILGAFIVNTGIILNADIWDSSNPERTFLSTLSVLLAFLSLGFAVVTLFSYDSLMMPFEFWSVSSEKDANPAWSVRRPPSQGHLILFYEMVHIWTVFFIPAIIAAFLSIYFFVFSLAFDSLANLLGAFWAISGALTLGAVVALVIVFWNRSKQPRLGFQD